MVERRLIQGDEACAQGAIAAGCTFFGGYPISPSSEIAEYMARELPRQGGVFIQMEDELASLGSVLGASLAGRKAMTATSGPGFTLMQEHLGYATLAEIPCVVVDVMRLGPSTGLPTSPSQGDVMQAKWGLSRRPRRRGTRPWHGQGDLRPHHRCLRRRREAAHTGDAALRRDDGSHARGRLDPRHPTRARCGTGRYRNRLPGTCWRRSSPMRRAWPRCPTSGAAIASTSPG